MFMLHTKIVYIVIRNAGMQQTHHQKRQGWICLQFADSSQYVPVKGGWRPTFECDARWLAGRKIDKLVRLMTVRVPLQAQRIQYFYYF